MVQNRGGVSTFRSTAQSFWAAAHLAPAAGLCVVLSQCGPPSWHGGIHAQLAWSTRGLRVLSVRAEGAAATAGLKPEDRIVVINDRAIAGLTLDEVKARLAGEVGSVVALTVVRGSQKLILRVARDPYERDKRP